MVDNIEIEADMSRKKIPCGAFLSPYRLFNNIVVERNTFKMRLMSE